MAKHENNDDPKHGTALVTYDFGADAGKGMENMDASEYRIPFVRILDPKSPQCKPVAQGGLHGAKGGAVFNTATGEILDGEKGFDFIPCARDHAFVEFVHRDKGGGFVQSFLPTDPIIQSMIKAQGRFKKLLRDPNDELSNQISETFSLYGILIPPDGSEQRVVIAFSGMQIKKYQNFFSRYMNIKYPVGDPPKLVLPPLWAHRWHFTTQYETRKDQSWYGWVIKLATLNPDGSEAPPVKSLMRMNDPLYQSGKEFNALIASGMAKADMTSANDVTDADDEEVPM